MTPTTGSALVDALEAVVPGAVARAVPASELSTYRLGGPFEVVVRVPDAASLARLVPLVADVPCLVIGRGSNLLVADTGYPGVGLVLAGEFDEVALDLGAGRARAGGAVALPVLARRCAAAGAAGLEFYVGIPGSVGGAVWMNAGGHGRETSEVLVAATVCDLRTGVVTDRPTSTIAFSYRHSGFGLSELVTGADFAVVADTVDACTARIDDIVRWRREHQPGGANGGSVFQNPPGDAAGRLIDAAGCKGLRVGGAVVSDKHANFFQAEPGATATDVHDLVVEVRRRVADAFGVVLEPELQMVGFREEP